MTTPNVLVTGFEPYGDWSENPAALIVEHLDGAPLAGANIVGRVLPVSLAPLASTVDALLAEVKPIVVISLGLHPGAATLRIERVGLNVADFARADNTGVVARDDVLDSQGVLALAATIPVRAISDAQLAHGLPSVVSNSAGTYLCNAVLYQFLAAVKRQQQTTRCGFIHLPFLPSQVAKLLSARNEAASGAAPGQEQLPSMHLKDQLAAVQLAAQISLDDS